MEFKKSFLLPLSLVAAFSPLTTLADQPSYSYVNGGYLKLDIDGSNVDPTGIFVRGSKEFGENWFVHAGYGWAEKSYGGADFDVEEFRIGPGFKFGLTENASLHVTASYITAEAEVTSDFGGDDKISEDGYGIDAGVRAMIADNFELNGNIGYSDDGDEDAVDYGVGAVWYLKSDFGILLEVGSDDDSNREYMIGFQIHF